MPEVTKVDQLEVAKHIKLSSKRGGIDVHCSDSTLGAWIENKGQSVGIVSDGRQLFICLYKDMKKLPVALSVTGIQIPDANNQPEFFTWDRLAEVLRK